MIFDGEARKNLQKKLSAGQFFGQQEMRDELDTDEPEINFDELPTTSATEYENSDQERQAKRQYHYMKATKYQPLIIDPETGAPFMNEEEVYNYEIYQQNVARMEPFMKTPFDKQEYNDWKKEVDKETVRTQLKIDQYNKSEQLLKAINARIKSAKSLDDQKELQNYLLSKIGYKNEHYSDFVGNQLTQKTEDAKQESKRNAMLKIQDQTEELLNFNDKQIRDSVNLQSKHVWHADQFVPASEIDKVTRQRDRELMSQAEFHKSRQRDQDYLQTQRLLWNGPVSTLSDRHQQKLYERTQVAELLTDGGSVLREIIKDMGITKSEEEQIDSFQTRNFPLITKDQTSKIAKENEKQAEEELDTLHKEMEQLDQQSDEEINKMVKYLEEDEKMLDEQEKAQPDGILPIPQDWDERNVSVSDEEGMSAGEKERRQQYFDELSEEEQLELIEKGGIKWPAHAYNKVSAEERDSIEKFIEEKPDVAMKLALELDQIEQASLAGETQDEDEIFSGQEQDHENYKKEKVLLFFEEEAKYLEFAKAFVRENGDGMTQEDAKKLRELQDEVRKRYMPHMRDSSNEDSDFFYNQPQQLLEENNEFSELERKNDLFGGNTSDSDLNGGLVEELDFSRMLQQDRGTFEGKRRFERIDRVSQDAKNDKIDQLKLKMRHERVYDNAGALFAYEAPIIIDATLSNNAQMEDVFEVQEQTKEEKQIGDYLNVELKEDAEQETFEYTKLDRKKPEQKKKIEELESERVRMYENINQQLAHKPQAEDGFNSVKISFDDLMNQKEAAEMINLPGQRDQIIAGQAGFIDEMHNQFNDAKIIEAEILKSRKLLAEKVQEAQNKLNLIHKNHQDLVKKLSKFNETKIEQQITPNYTQYDFIKGEQYKRVEKKQAQLQQMASQNPKFDSKAQQALEYENELFTISKMGLLKTKKQKEELLKQYEFVFECIRLNRVKLTTKIRAHMFEYLVVRNDFEMANSQLKILSTDLTESLSPIDVRYLSLYLKNCLKLDQIDGIAYLVNYCKRYNVDCSDMPIEKFHSMLDFYLNHKFDLSKVMIFCKFYRKFYDDKMTKGLGELLIRGIRPGQLTDEQKIDLKDKVFGKHDNLIDMRALSKFLVLKTAEKQIIDPLTHEDSLRGLMELFTQSPDIYEASSLSKNNHIEPATIAEYFGYRLNLSDSLKQISQVVFRLNQTKVGRDFSRNMLQQLKSFQASRNGALPQSFTQEAVKELYFKIRASKVQLDAQSSEFILYILQQKGLHAEVIDFCERSPKQEITSYYLTESLLQLPLKSGTYTQALDKSGALEDQNQQSELQAFQLTQKTKAMLLDKGPEVAYNFFQEEFSKMEEKAKQKKAFLVSIYDQIMPTENEGISFETFKERYLKSSQLAVRFAKEAFVVNQMQKLLKNKNYDEIDSMFNLYAVMREERLLQNIEYIMDNEDLQQILKKTSDVSQRTKEVKLRLQDVSIRKLKLQKLVGKQEYITLASIARVMKDQELQVFESANANQMQQVASIFNDVTSEEAETIESRNKELWGDEISDISGDMIKRKLISMGNKEELIDSFLEQQQSDEEQVQSRDSSEDQKNKALKKLKADHQAILESMNKPAFWLKLYRKYENDPEHKDEFKNSVFDTEPEDMFSQQSEKEEASRIQFLQTLQDNYGSDIEEVFYDEIEHTSSSEQEDSLKNDLPQLESQNKDEQSLDEDQSENALNKSEILKKLLEKKNSLKKSSIDEASLSNTSVIPSKKPYSLEEEIQIQFEQLIESNSEEESEQSNEELTEESKLDHELYEELKRQESEIENKILAKKQKIQNAADQRIEEEFSSTQDEEEIFQMGVDEKQMEDEIEELINNQDAIGVPFSDLSDKEDKIETVKVMKQLWDMIDANTKFYFSQNKERYLQPEHEQEYLEENMERYFNIQIKKERPNLHYDRPRYNEELQDEIKFQDYRKKLMTDPLLPSEMINEPDALEETIHDASVFTLKEQLIDAMNKRKYEALPLMVKIFNRLQRKNLGDAYMLEDFEGKNVNDFTILNQNDQISEQSVQEVQVENIGETLKKLDLLLCDSRSPILSTLMETSKYKTQKLPENADDYYPDAQSFVREPLDVGAFKRDFDKLEILKFELERIQKTAAQIEKRIKYSQENVEGEMNAKLASEWKEQQKEIKEQQMGRLRLLHADFNKSFTSENLLSNEAKVRIMRDILALELGQSFNVNSEEGKTANQFPVFYALDLINFGIKRNQPAAIRLGEKLLTDSCSSEQAKMPKDLAQAVRNYMLDYNNNMQYREAMKITGPINSSSVYHMANQKSVDKTTTLCLDDPYWKEFILKNRRREDQWRNPSIFAYRYKQFGILGEIFDMQNIQKRYEQEFNQSK